MTYCKLLLIALLIYGSTPYLTAQEVFQRIIDPWESSTTMAWSSVEQVGEDRYLLATTYEEAQRSIGEIQLTAFQRNGDILWSKAYRSGYEQMVNASTCTEKGCIVVGRIDPNLNDGPDAFVMATDAEGNVQWSKALGVPSTLDMGYAVERTEDGGVVVAGQSGSRRPGALDVLVSHLDSNGKALWTSTYGGNGDDMGYAVIQTADGFVVAGSTTTTAGDKDAYVFKLNREGEVLWSKRYGSSELDEAYAIVQTTDGGFVFTGSTQRPGGLLDIHSYVVKITADGEVVWSRRIDAPTIYGRSFESATGVALGEMGRIAVLSHAGRISVGNNIRLIELDLDGTLLWSREYGGGDDERGYTLKRNRGGFLLTGGSSSFGPRKPAAYLLQTDGEGNAGCNGRVPDITLRLDTTIAREQLTISTSKDFVRDIVETSDTLRALVGVICNGSPESPSGRTFQRAFSSPRDISLRGLCQSIDGYLIGANARLLDLATGYARTRYALVKTNELGELQWGYTYDNRSEEHLWQLLGTGDGGALLTGSSGDYYRGMYAVRVGPDGAHQWSKVYQGIGEFPAICHTRDGGFACADWFDTLGVLGGKGYGITRLDARGNHLWSQGIIADSTTMQINGIRQTENGDFVVTGLSYVDHDLSVYLGRFDSVGTLLWQRYYTIPSFRYEQGVSIHETGGNGFVLAGHARESSFGNFYMTLLSVDSAGEPRWGRSYWGTEIGYLTSMSPTVDGGYILTGGSLTSAPYANQPYLVKIDSLGDVLWSYSYVSKLSLYGNWTGVFSSVIEKSDGGYLAAGMFYSISTAIHLASVDSSGASSCARKLIVTAAGAVDFHPVQGSRIRQIPLVPKVIDLNTVTTLTEYKLTAVDLCDGLAGVAPLPLLPSNTFASHPNPVERGGQTQLQIPPGISGTITIAVMEMTGRVLRQFTVVAVGREISVDTRGLAPGIYLVAVQHDKGSSHLKLVVR